jgi:hypothetical protein
MRPHERILRFLAVSNQPCNKYQIEKRTGLSRNSLYRGIERLRTLRWIRVAHKGKARTGLPMEFYELTDLGIYTLGLRGLETSKLVAGRLTETKIKEFEERVSLSRRTGLEQLLENIRPIWISRKAAPGWEFVLKMKANQEGRVSTKFSVGFPVGFRSASKEKTGPSQ